jgi:hypothetical protein
MANVTVNSVDIPLARGGVDHSYEEVGGDRVRMADGTMRSNVTTTKQVWRLTTVPLSASDFSTVQGAVTGLNPVSCSGDALGSTVTCIPEALSATRVRMGGAIRYVVTFALHQQ